MRELSKEEKQIRIAKNAAALIDGDESCSVINLGVGIPTLVANYLTREKVYIMAENGMVGVGPMAAAGQAHPDLINAGRQPVLETRGCAYMDSAESFGMIRGGHVDMTVLGAFEVDEEASIANWIIPGGKQLGVGGAMDLICGARKVLAAMTHTGKNGLKLVKRCSLPLTAKGAVDSVVTEYGVFTFRDGKLHLKRIAPEISLEELRRITEIEFEAEAETPLMLV